MGAVAQPRIAATLFSARSCWLLKPPRLCVLSDCDPCLTCRSAPIRALCHVGAQRENHHAHRVQDEVEHLGHEVVAGGRPDIALVEPAHAPSLQRLETVRHPQLRVVCVSIYPRRGEIDQLGASAHLVKPVSLRELESAIGRVLPPP